MANGRFSANTYPFYGRVWFEGRPKFAAAIYGTVNGWAVCKMEWSDAVRLLKSSKNLRVRVVKNEIRVSPAEAGALGGAQDEVVPIDSNGMAWFDGGWSLLHERDPKVGGLPSPPGRGVARMLRIHKRGSGYSRG